MGKKQNIEYELGKIAVEAREDYQRIRISQKNRIRDVIRRKIEGIPLDKPEEKKEKKTYDDKYNDKNISKYLIKLVADKKLNGNEREYIEKLFKIAVETKKTERKYEVLMDQYLSSEKLWYAWLEDIRGISSVLGSNLLKNFGYCENYKYISSLWKHCGYDPEGAKGRRKGKTISYNPKLKTLVWKIGDSFIKQKSQPYRSVYDAEKNRQLSLMENKAENAPKSRLHADFRARRKMVKVFLQHYWLVGRHLKGLELSMPYAFDKLGHVHFIPPPFYNLEINDGQIDLFKNMKT